MIYVDTSVILAELLAEDWHPPDALWGETLVASRLLEYELWTRLNVLALGDSHGDAARALVDRVALLEMISPVLSRALEAFPRPVRTLDAIHLASLEFLRERQPSIRLATYDTRMDTAARAMGVKPYPLNRDSVQQ